MDRGSFSAAGSATPPAAPATPSSAYPTDGDPLTAIPATIPGAWWFHAVTEEIRNTLLAAGITPDYADTTQLAAAVQALAAAPEIVKQTTAAQNYIKYTQYTFPHTLGVEPGVLQLKARCKTAEGGFSFGDVVFMEISAADDTGSGQDVGHVTWADEDNIYLSLDLNHEIRTHEKNSNARFIWTDSYWELFFFALA